jgi:hypothetical protein
MKYGPVRLLYRDWLTYLAKACGEIYRFSLMAYSLAAAFIYAAKV